MVNALLNFEGFRPEAFISKFNQLFVFAVICFKSVKTKIMFNKDVFKIQLNFYYFSEFSAHLCIIF